MALVIFDLDNTLIGGDSDYLWGEFLAEHDLVDSEYYQTHNLQFLKDYEAGKLDIFKYLEFSLKFLTEYDLDVLEGIRQQFVAEKIEPIILPQAEALIAQHKAKGDECIIVTATNSFVTRRIADRLGIDTLIGTEPELVNDRYTGKVLGTPSFREGKVVRLHEWIALENKVLQGSYFYSDSHNDIPLLEEVTYPIAVDPDPELLSYAKQKDWPVMSLREI